jgi:hypothetical protein
MTLQTSRLWSAGEKMAFRFFFVFFVLYIFPFPLSYVPYLGGWLSLEPLWRIIVPWTGAQVLHLPAPVTIFTNGSGDTTYDYVKLFVMAVSAVAVALVWSAGDRRRRSYDALHHWLRVGLRYYLASTLCMYGFSKIYHLQMPGPFLSQLVLPFGDKSPMGLVWSYVGFSGAFSAFTGWAEVIAGVFLLFRRTTLLGAMLSAFVMLNVVMINFCFDVPVKLYSSFLLLASLFLMAPDFGRMAGLFLLNKPVRAKTYRGYLHKRWLRISAVVLKCAFIAMLFISQLQGTFARAKRSGKASHPPLYGIYNTELLARGHDTIPPLTTDTTRWRQLIVQHDSYAQVKLMNDSMEYISFRVDTTLKTVSIAKRNKDAQKSVLHYTSDSAYLTLSGLLDNDSVTYRFRKYDHNRFRLISTGFRWVNEYPYNR